MTGVVERSTSRKSKKECMCRINRISMTASFIYFSEYQNIIYVAVICIMSQSIISLAQQMAQNEASTSQSWPLFQTRDKDLQWRQESSLCSSVQLSPSLLLVLLCCLCELACVSWNLGGSKVLLAGKNHLCSRICSASAEQFAIL